MELDRLLKDRGLLTMCDENAGINATSKSAKASKKSKAKHDIIIQYMKGNEIEEIPLYPADQGYISFFKLNFLLVDNEDKDEGPYVKIPSVLLNNLEKLKLVDMLPIQQALFTALFCVPSKPDVVGMVLAEAGYPLGYLFPAICVAVAKKTSDISSMIFVPRDKQQLMYDSMKRLVDGLDPDLVFNCDSFDSVKRLADGSSNHRIVITTYHVFRKATTDTFLHGILDDLDFLIIDDVDERSKRDDFEDYQLLTTIQKSSNCQTILLCSSIDKSYLTKSDNNCLVASRSINNIPKNVKAFFFSVSNKASEMTFLYGKPVVPPDFGALKQPLCPFDKVYDLIADQKNKKICIFVNGFATVTLIGSRLKLYGKQVAMLDAELKNEDAKAEYDRFVSSPDVNILVATEIVNHRYDFIPDIIINYEMPKRYDIFMRRLHWPSRFPKAVVFITLLPIQYFRDPHEMRIFLIFITMLAKSNDGHFPSDILDAPLFSLAAAYLQGGSEKPSDLAATPPPISSN